MAVIILDFDVAGSSIFFNRDLSYAYLQNKMEVIMSVCCLSNLAHMVDICTWPPNCVCWTLALLLAYSPVAHFCWADQMFATVQQPVVIQCPSTSGNQLLSDHLLFATLWRPILVPCCWLWSVANMSSEQSSCPKLDDNSMIGWFIDWTIDWMNMYQTVILKYVPNHDLSALYI